MLITRVITKTSLILFIYLLALPPSFAGTLPRLGAGLRQIVSNSVRQPLRPAAKSFERIYQFERLSPTERASRFNQISGKTDHVLVAVLDTGIDYNHPNLAYKIPRNGTCFDKFINSDSLLPFDFDGHGTAVAGIIVQGVQGLKPASLMTRRTASQGTEEGTAEGTEGLKAQTGISSDPSDKIAILPLRFLDTDDSAYKMVAEAYEKGSFIINLSASIPPESPHYDLDSAELKKAILDHPQILFVVSAGNRGFNNDERPHIPGSFKFPNLIVVGSTYKKDDWLQWISYRRPFDLRRNLLEQTSQSDSDDSSDIELSKFSNYGVETVHLAAPGENIEVIGPGGLEGVTEGTSMAAPQVTRVCAEMKAINPSLSATEIKAILQESVTHHQSLEGKLKWGGVLNPEEALERARKTLK